ncbi:hypothetical protein BC826DRAFT_171554 [Russula brevipes]|nr:hypothetical protein BC826DRAFT_171554 [Russula brevipes]
MTRELSRREEPPNDLSFLNAPRSSTCKKTPLSAGDTSVAPLPTCPCRAGATCPTIPSDRYRSFKPLVNGRKSSSHGVISTSSRQRGRQSRSSQTSRRSTVESGGGRDGRQTCARDEICPSDSKKIRDVNVQRSTTSTFLVPVLSHRRRRCLVCGERERESVIAMERLEKVTSVRLSPLDVSMNWRNCGVLNMSCLNNVMATSRSRGASTRGLPGTG